MSSSIVGNLIVRLAADTGTYESGIRKSQKSTDRQMAKMQKSVEKFRKQSVFDFKRVAKQSALMATSFAAAGLAIAKTGLEAQDKVGKLADQLGIGTEALSRLQFAAKQTGSSADKLSAGLEVMSKRLGEVAIKGSGAAKKGLDALGLSAKDLIQLKPDEQFKKIAEAMSHLGTQAERNAVAANIFSRANQNLVNTLAAGKQGLQDYADESDRLGNTVTPAMAAAAAKATDAMGRLGTAMSGVKNVVASALAPGITDISNRLSGALSDGLEHAETLVRNFTKAIGLLAAAMAGRLVTAFGRMVTATYASTLAMEGAATGMASYTMATRVATGATRGLRTAMALLGGPVGVFFLAATAAFEFRKQLGLVSTTTDDAKKAVDEFTGSIDRNSRAVVDNGLAKLQLDLVNTKIKAEAAQKSLEQTYKAANHPVSMAGGAAISLKRSTASASLDKYQAKIKATKAGLVSLQAARSKFLAPAGGSPIRSLMFGDTKSNSLTPPSAPPNPGSYGGGAGGGAGPTVVNVPQAPQISSEGMRDSQELLRIKEGLRTQQERINESYEHNVEIVQRAVTDDSKRTKMLTKLGARHQEQLERVNDQYGQMGDAAADAADSIKNSLGDTLQMALSGHFKGIGKMWAHTVEKMATDAVSSSIGKALFGGAGGSGGVFGKILGAAGSALFGGAKAAGGPVTSSKAYLVGEKGPELFSPGRSGSITPNHKMGTGVRGAAPTIINNVSYTEAPGKSQSERDRDHREFVRQLQESMQQTVKSTMAQMSATGEMDDVLSPYNLNRNMAVT